jgi:hypothetical protein
MQGFLVECCTANGASNETARRARAGAAELMRDGTEIRFVNSIFVPNDETWIVYFEAPSVDVVLAAARRADLRVGRIAAAHPSCSARGEL